MADLVERWHSGDSAAFEALFRQYEKMVFKTAYLITGDVERAKDIMQDVFIAVWKGCHSFDPQKGKFTTWLHRITVNKCSKKKRKNQPLFFSLEQAQEKGLQLQSHDYNPGDSAAII